MSPVGFQAQITSDPVYRAALSSSNLNMQTGRNALRDSIRQMVIASGIDPTKSLTGELAGYAADLDPTTLATAAQNPLSAMRGFQGALDVGKQNLRYVLAARGLTGSGGVASGQSVLGMNYDRSTHDALQKMLAGIQTGAGTYAGLQASESGKLNEAMTGVAARLAQLPGGLPARPRVNPATAATIARGRAYGAAYKKNPRVFGGGV